MNLPALEREKQLAALLSGYQLQVRTAGRAWTTLAVLSVYSLSVALRAPEQAAHLELPLIDAELPRSWFLLISLGIMAALSVRWVEAHTRSVRVRLLAQPLIDAKPEDLGISQHDMWDAQVAIATSTVWSSPAGLLASRHLIVRRLAVPHLLLLKSVSLVVHYALPGAALAYSTSALLSEEQLGIPVPWQYVAAGMATIGAAQLVLSIRAEYQYSLAAVRRLQALALAGQVP